MTEFRVVWCQRPHAYNIKRVLFVVAASAKEASRIAEDHIERKMGTPDFSILKVTPAESVPKGKVVEWEQ